MCSRDSSARFISEYFGKNEPLSTAETDQLASALYKLAMEGEPIPQHLLRHEYTGDLNTSRHCGHTLNAIPAALDRLGPDRETVVVKLIRRFEKAVKDHHDHVKNRKTGDPIDRDAMQRYFDVAFLLCAVKPKTEESVLQVVDFLRSDKSDVHQHASEMLEGAPYFPVIVDRLFENVATYGIRQWPNRQSKALASFAHVPEVRLRLMDCFHSERESLRHLAVMAFGWLKEKAGPDAEAELFAIAGNEADNLQGAALGTLHAITPRSPRLRQLALRLIHSDKYWVRGNAITCLEAFQDRESVDALLATLLDEGGPDFDNAGNAARLLRDRPLDPKHVLEPLMATFKALLEREDKAYEGQTGFRVDVQTIANIFKSAAEQRGEGADGVGTVSYPSPETLLAVARVLGHLCEAAAPAIALIEDCSARPYVAPAIDIEEWQKILEEIRSRGNKLK